VTTPTAPNVLEASGLPLVYPVETGTAGLPAPPDRRGFDVAVRTTVTSFTVMQKEAVVATSASPVSWRLSSDEGPYLAGHDFAPPPLAVMAAGLAADLIDHIARAVHAVGLGPDPFQLTLNTRYSMEGSLLRGTMVGGALPPEIIVVTAPGDRSTITGAVLTGVASSATSGLIGAPLDGLFSLTAHERRIPVGRVTALADHPPATPAPVREWPPAVTSPNSAPLVVKVREVDDHPPDAGVGLQDSQDRGLHLRAVGHTRPDGLKTIDVHLIRPNGSTFRFLADDEPGGRRRAPDALSYISAGLGFCFMTQIGRYAKVSRQALGNYQIVQDTRFSVGDPTADPPVGGRAAPPETHVFLAPEGSDEDFARTALDMSAQTCFLHALCRSELRPKLHITPAKPRTQGWGAP
jgi:hypothetical protein